MCFKAIQMNALRRRRVMGVAWRLSAILLAAFMAMNSAAAQEDPAPGFPSRPIRIVVPFPAGGPTDILSRVIGQKMSEAWGQAVIIENRPGANTAIGDQIVARSAPDGYALVAAMDSTRVVSPAASNSL